MVVLLDLQSTSNHSLERTPQEVTRFAYAKPVPSCAAAQLRR